jgi:hypothetical protein
MLTSQDMWLSVWTWSLSHAMMSFGGSHFVAGIVCAFRYRNEMSKRYKIGIILCTIIYLRRWDFSFLSQAAGAVTGADEQCGTLLTLPASLLALVHSYSGIAMSTTCV